MSVTTPGPATGFADRCAELCPGFRATGSIRRARKSELLAGEIGGAPVIAKRLLRPNAVWDWYFAREVAVYRSFAAAPPAFRAPRVHAVADDVFVIERFPISLARLRRPYGELPAPTVEALIGLHHAIAHHTFPSEPPPANVVAHLRQRLLEDPCDPAWIREGLARSHARSWIDDDTLAAARGALDAYAPIASGHGDLLLRNAMEAATGEIVLVDWECAGRYVADWDLALLWTQLGPRARDIVEAAVTGTPRRTSFVALVVFALCRELAFLDAFRTPADHRGRLRVLEDLAAQQRRL